MGYGLGHSGSGQEIARGAVPPADRERPNVGREGRSPPKNHVDVDLFACRGRESKSWVWDGLFGVQGQGCSAIIWESGVRASRRWP